MISDLLLLAPAALVLAFLLWRRRKAPAVPIGPPTNALVVDGSNAMHWGGDPSADVLRRVLRALEKKGYAPIVFFDANVGYVLGSRYYDEAMLSKLIDHRAEHICVVGRGVVADEAILAFATDHDLRVVTNDRYRDWRVQFPLAARKGALVRGAYREGSVVFHNL